MAAKKASDECWRSFVNHLLWLAFFIGIIVLFTWPIQFETS